MRLWIAIGMVWVGLVGCVDLSVQQQRADVEDVAMAPAAAESLAADDADDPILVQTAEWEGDTLLNAIAQLKAATGTPLAHRYVEFDTDSDGVWQGEALIYADNVIMLAQQMQTGNRGILRVDVPNVPEYMAAVEQALAPSTTTTNPPDAEITFVRARLRGDNTWSFDVAVDHPDTGWEDYTDGWHVETPDGEILATRILLHPHVGERPFTRGQGGVVVPEGVTEVYIRSHDLISGYSQQPVRIPLAEAVNTETYQVER